MSKNRKKDYQKLSDNFKKEIIRYKNTSNKTYHMNINLMTCPKCGTVYHWGIRGWGNCPTCNKDSLPRKVKEEEI